MKIWKVLVIVLLLGLTLVGKRWYPQGGDQVRQVFFGEMDQVVSVFGGEPWGE